MITRAIVTIAACVLFASAARAEDGASDDPLEAITSVGGSTERFNDRSWLYNDSTRIPAPGRAVGMTRFTYGSGGPARAFAGNLGTTGALLELGGEVGLIDHVSAIAIGAQGQDNSNSSRTGGMLGLRWSILPRSITATQLVMSGGFISELQGNSGAWGRISLGHDLGLTRLALSVHGQRIFAAGRDSLDVMVSAGATMRLMEELRAGIEYVGQDLEGAFGTEAEGGARHILGPVLAAGLWDQRISLVGGPAIALGPGQPRALGRVGLSCQF